MASGSIMTSRAGNSVVIQYSLSTGLYYIVHTSRLITLMILYPNCWNSDLHHEIQIICNFRIKLRVILCKIRYFPYPNCQNSDLHHEIQIICNFRIKLRVILCVTKYFPSVYHIIDFLKVQIAQIYQIELHFNQAYTLPNDT